MKGKKFKEVNKEKNRRGN